MSYDDLYPGETGTSFTVRSPAFSAPVRLAHDPEGADWNNPRLFSAVVALPPALKDGTYKAALTGADGRTVKERPFVVRAARPGDPDYLGRASGPAFFGRSDGPGAARPAHRVPAGGRVNVLWRDKAPDPGEEERLTATSPAFEHPVRLRRDVSKAGDGDDPRYFGPARVRRGLEAGRYPVTVVSHRGRVERTGHLQVTGSSAAAPEGGGPTGPVVAAGAGGAALTAGAGVLLIRRRAAARGAGSRGPAPAG
ncbi:hypothetical protein ACFQ2B_19930 [Streptomyces stramineus]